MTWHSVEDPSLAVVIRPHDGNFLSFVRGGEMWADPWLEFVDIELIFNGESGNASKKLTIDNGFYFKWSNGAVADKASSKDFKIM